MPTLPTIRLGLRLILLTMVRKGELLDATWDEIDFENAVWSIPKERMKRKKPHNVYLSRQCLDMMIALKTCAASSRYVLPSRYDADEPMSRAKKRGAARLLSASPFGHAYGRLASLRAQRAIPRCIPFRDARSLLRNVGTNSYRGGSMMTAMPAQRVEMIPVDRIAVVNPRIRNKRSFRDIVDNIFRDRSETAYSRCPSRRGGRTLLRSGLRIGQAGGLQGAWSTGGPRSCRRSRS